MQQNPASGTRAGAITAATRGGVTAAGRQRPVPLRVSDLPLFPISPSLRLVVRLSLFLPFCSGWVPSECSSIGLKTHTSVLNALLVAGYVAKREIASQVLRLALARLADGRSLT